MIKESKNYINAIGVLSYTLTDPPITLIPEYYYKNEPPIVSAASNNNFYAYGWLAGGNNITATFNIDTKFDNYLSSNIEIIPGIFSPYLSGALYRQVQKQQYDSITILSRQNIQRQIITEIIPQHLVSGIYNLAIPTNFTNTTCYLTGTITGDIINLSCSGQLNGYLSNTDANNNVYVSAKVEGTIEQIKQININGNFIKISEYNLALIKTLSGIVKTDILNVSTKTGLNYIDNTDILGRDLLGYKNSLNGYNLNTYPDTMSQLPPANQEQFIKDSTGLKSQKWKIVQVFNTTREKFMDSLNINSKILTGVTLNNTQLMIKTNQKIIQHGKIIDNYLINYPPVLLATQNKAYKLNIDQTLEYYAILDTNNNRILLIDQFNSSILSDGKQLLFGPIATYEQTIQLLKECCEIYGYYVDFPPQNIKISEFKLKELIN